jgi:hypothetical protein
MLAASPSGAPGNSRWGTRQGTTHVWFELERPGPRITGALRRRWTNPCRRRRRAGGGRRSVRALLLSFSVDDDGAGYRGRTPAGRTSFSTAAVVRVGVARWQIAWVGDGTDVRVTDAHATGARAGANHPGSHERKCGSRPADRKAHAPSPLARVMPSPVPRSRAARGPRCPSDCAQSEAAATGIAPRRPTPDVSGSRTFNRALRSISRRAGSDTGRLAGIV